MILEHAKNEHEKSTALNEWKKQSKDKRFRTITTNVAMLDHVLSTIDMENETAQISIVSEYHVLVVVTDNTHSGAIELR